MSQENVLRMVQALFPPSRKVLEEYYVQGYMDTYRWLQMHEVLDQMKEDR